MARLAKDTLVPTSPLLQRTTLSEVLDDAQLRQLEQVCSGISRRPGTVVFRQGERAETAFVLSDGSVELRARPPGRRVYRTVEVLRAPCTVGEEALFGEEEYVTSARALEPARLLALSRASFTSLTRAHPDIAAALLLVAGSCLLQTIRRCAILTQAPADVALRMLLQELAARDPSAGGASAGMVRITHSQLAGVLHLSRETVSRMLRQMADQGYVALGRGVIRIRESS